METVLDFINKNLSLIGCIIIFAVVVIALVMLIISNIIGIVNQSKNSKRMNAMCKTLGEINTKIDTQTSASYRIESRCDAIDQRTKAHLASKPRTGYHNNSGKVHDIEGTKFQSGSTQPSFNHESSRTSEKPYYRHSSYSKYHRPESTSSKPRETDHDTRDLYGRVIK